MYKSCTRIEPAGSTITQKHDIAYNRQQFTTHRRQIKEVLDYTVLETVRCYVAGIAHSRDELTAQSFVAGTRRRHDGTRKVTVSLPVLNTATEKLTRNDSLLELDTDATNPPVNASHCTYDQC
jgi:hypothetical protein